MKLDEYRNQGGQQRIAEEAQKELSKAIEADARAANKEWRNWDKSAEEELGGSVAVKFLKARPGEEQEDPEIGGVPQVGQAALEVVLQAWMPLWAKETRKKELHPCQWKRGQALPPIEGEQVREVLARYPQGTGLGWDRLHPRALEQLPQGYCDRLAAILNLWEADPRPTALWTMITVFLAKPEGGLRPIHLLAMAMRV